MANIVELKNLCKSYSNGKDNRLEVLKNICLTIESGEFTAIIGKSGSGKSTLLNIIGCTDGFDSGEYLFCGRNIVERNDNKLSKIRGNEISFIFQDYALIEEESALHNVETPLYFNGKTRFGNIRKVALEALRTVGISELAHKKVACLSGGQKQRVAIARAIVNSPKLILADEPTGALDSKTAESIFDVLKSLNETGVTVVIVTHDKDIASKCNKVLEIVEGTILENIII